MSENLIWLFMSLLTAPFLKSGHIMPGIYFIFLRERPRQNMEGFPIPNFDVLEDIIKKASDIIRS